MLKTKYRIVKIGPFYDIEEWDYFWPFWVSSDLFMYYFACYEDAERSVKTLISQSRKEVVKEFF